MGSFFLVHKEYAYRGIWLYMTEGILSYETILVDKAVDSCL